MSDEAPVRAGDILAGKYRVDRVLGVGGMGVVVSATHLQLDQQVALKFMLPAAFANAEAMGRFQREAKSAVKLKSEHVARVIDVGTLETGSPYIVMEYLSGSDLSDLVTSRGALPVGEAAEYIIQACDALAEAHMLGIVHRDLKPANLFLTKRGDGTPLVKVLDFGISKAGALGEAGLAMTKTASMMGSPLYMSPEQMRSAKDVDARSDVWSLGVILYELVGGRVPFNADTLGELMARVLTEPPPPLASIQPNLPIAFTSLVDSCMQKDLSLRCANVAQLARGLAPFAPSRAQPIAERIVSVIGELPIAPPPISSVATTQMLSGNMPAIGTTAPGWGVTGSAPQKKHGVAMIVGGVGLFAIVGAIGVAALVMRHHETRDANAVAITSATAAATATTTTATTAAIATTTTQGTSAPTPMTSTSASPIVIAHAGGATTSKTAHGPASAQPTATAAVAVTATATAAPTSTKKPGVLDESY